MKTILSPILLSFVLTACGGGGTASTSSVPAVPLLPASLPATLHDTSYKNFKSYPIDTFIFPTSNYGLSKLEPMVYGFGEFTKQGELSVFIANQNYNTPPADAAKSLWEISSDTKYLSDFTFWTINSDKTLTKVSSVKGCLHPRKAVVADFNKDGIPDVLVACHGYDFFPFPGEKSKLLLSDGRGNYVMSDVLDQEFTHGAAAADVNGDGYPDIVRAAGVTLGVFINQKDGTFVKQSNIISNNTVNGYFNVEIVDIDGDGINDIIASGNDWNPSQDTPTKIWYGSSSGLFGERITVVPPVPGRGVVNDFTLSVKGDQRILYVNRTSDNTAAGGWYRGLAIQSYNLTTGNSTIIADQQNISWVFWLIPKIKDNLQGIGPFNSSAFFNN